MKKTLALHIQKGFTVSMLTLLLLSQNTLFVFAQEATGSATTPTASTSGEVHDEYATSSAMIVPQVPETNPFEVESVGSVKSLAKQLANDLQVSLQSFNSAAIRQPVVIGKLQKHTFAPQEAVSVTVGNAAPEEITVTVVGPMGQDVDEGAVEKVLSGTSTTVTINPSAFNFRPGKYTLKITDASGDVTTQDFTWGVLAINTNKSLYTPQETSQIAMAVLDDMGNMVCDAQVSLTITSPTKTVTTLSTKDKTITVSPQCTSYAFSLVPDYSTSYNVQGVGDYDVSLSATTKNGTNTISDTIHVVKDVPFVVERQSATRLYPLNTYPMIFHITAQQDFTGSIIESAPANFTVSPYATTSAQPYTAANLVMPISDATKQFGTNTLSLGMPFSGNAKMVQGFGVALTDPAEAAYYAQYGLAGHDGLDFGLSSGTPVLATDDGIVALAGDGAYGTTIVIEHTWGKSYYGHLSTTKVSVGEKVTKGQEIGLSGASGHVTGPHLHFGIKPLHPDMQNGFYGKVDPTPYLSSLAQVSGVLGVTTANVTSSQKLITWNVALKKGDKIDLAYSFQSPPQSPAFFTLGPLKFLTKGENTVFQEARQWQLAIDADSTAGPNNCATGADVVLAGSSSTWGTPANACANRKSTSTSIPSSQLYSDYLQVSNFGFTTTTVPANAVIKGIQFAVSRTGTTGLQGDKVTDHAVYAVKGGTIGGNDHANTSGWNVTTSLTYGATNDLWGLTWTPSDIQASTFGIAISAAGGLSSSLTATVNAFVTATITYNTPPNAPTQNAPANSATGVSTTPTFTMTATDPSTDNLQYKVTIYSNSGCTSVVQTNNQNTSQSGWSGTNATCTNGGACYTSGTQGTYVAQSALAGTTQYWWKASAVDPDGSNTFTDSTTCNTFTTGAPAGPTLDQLLKHGMWFNSGVKQPFTF